MSWASRRRLVILLLIGAVAVAVIATLSVTVFYKAPSCTDGALNQGETGVDCGGPCPYLCTEQERAPTVLFTKALPSGTGRTDIIASVENVNAGAAAKDVPYSVTLYGAGHVFIQQITGTLDLPPAATVPVFIPRVPIGSRPVVSAFLTIDPTAPRWFALARDTREVLVVTNTTLGGTSDAPRIDAILTNNNVSTLSDVQVVVLVHSTQGEVIAASATILPTVPAQGKAAATFTWNSAFVSAPAAIEVIPVIPVLSK